MSLAVHMLLHCALVSVVAPLVVLVSPLRLELHSRAARLLIAPALAWSLFVGTQIAFHLAALYEEPLWADSLTHLAYLGTALLFWEVAIGRSLLPRRLNGLGPSLYLLLAMPAVDLSAAWLMAIGEPGAGVAMVAGMTPLGLAAALSAWRYAREEESRAGLEETA